MHVRTKFDGGKVINISQSGSWEHRCMGAGLRQNLGMQWGHKVYSHLTYEETKCIKMQQKLLLKRLTDRNRKATDQAKENRRKSKYSMTDNSTAACKDIVGTMAFNLMMFVKILAMNI